MLKLKKPGGCLVFLGFFPVSLSSKTYTNNNIYLINYVLGMFLFMIILDR